MSSLRLLFFLLIFSFTPTHSFHHDRLSLLAFKNLITSDPRHFMADWSPANPFCNWTGVTCNRRHPNRVASLDLAEMDLRGSISPSLGNLSFLRSLDLGENMLTGHIPPQLGRLFRLRELDLSNNELEGNIPNQLSSCRNLTQLSLSFNNLTGNIPREFGSLPHLQKLYLGKNDLTGTIPSSLGNLSSLIHLALEHNSLTGPIPSQLCSCKNLTFVALSFNNLKGNIPREFGSLPHLQKLYLGENDLTGAIPSSLGNLSSLVHLTLDQNSLTGSIPSQLSSCRNLTLLLLQFNDLTGTIPSSLGNLSSLVELHLTSNNLTGTIPSSLGNLSSLLVLIIANNNLVGPVPQELGRLTRLEQNRILTWDSLRRKGWEGPGICPLCRKAQEDTQHLMFLCEFTKDVWNRISKHYNLSSSWSGDSIFECFSSWHLNNLLPFPLAVYTCWNLWIERNKALFEDRSPSTLAVFHRVLASFTWQPSSLKIHTYKDIDLDLPEGFTLACFDGAAHASGSCCGAGGFFRTHQSRITKWILNCGPGTNTRAELLGLWVSLYLASEWSINHLLVRGDSKVIIDWISHRSKLCAIHVDSWKQKTMNLARAFTNIRFQHIPRAFNGEADALSKRALNEVAGNLLIFHIDSGIESQIYSYSIF